MTWSLAELFTSLHEDVQHRLGAVRSSFAHPGTLGDASEAIWLDVLQTYLPNRYSVAGAHVVDSKGVFSQQLDVVIFDRQYTPFMFKFAGKLILPAESVYAVFEAKQSVDAKQIKYAADKVASIRSLHRTSMPIPSVGRDLGAKTLLPILGGLLALESEWKPALGQPLRDALEVESPGSLDLGCVAAHGIFWKSSNGYAFGIGVKPATAFLFELISRLQAMATVPMIDMSAYAKWL